MSANQTQDKSINLLVVPLDMKAVSQLVLRIKCFLFSVCIVVIYNKESFVVLGNTCSVTINSASPAKM